MPHRLVFLETKAPTWFTVEPRSVPDALCGVARPTDTAWSQDGLALVLRPDGGRIAVSEPIVGTQLPDRCAERHIQMDQTFCLGLDALGAGSVDEAQIWWAHLEQWLQLQSLAHETGLWPDAHALDHGHAGEWQQAAQRLADELGFSEEYRRSHAGLPSWITDRTTRIAQADGSPINGRAACPLGCTKTRGRRSKPVLWGECDRRAEIARLVAMEAHRRRALEQYWESERGAPCCGTMINCPLRPANEAWRQWTTR